MIAETSDHLQHSSRQFAVRDSVAIWLMRRRFPRIAVSIALVVSGAIGFYCSMGLHKCGLTAMWIRYPLAVAVSSLVFTFLLGVLARRTSRLLEEVRDEVQRDAVRRQFRRNDAELPDPSKFMEDISEASRHARQDGGDPRALPVFLIIFLAITVVLVCIYLVWMAPVILADVVIEGSLVAWLYRPSFSRDDSGETSALIEKTAIPTVCLALAFAAAGLGFQLYAPQATNAEEVWNHLVQQRNLAIARRGGVGR